MKKGIVIIVLLLNCWNIAAQNPLYYSATNGDLRFGITLTVDKGADVNYLNSIPNEPNGNLIYIANTKNITLFGYVNKDSTNFYRYTIQVGEKEIISDANPKLPGKLTNSNILQFELGKFNIENKKIIITYYKVGQRSNVGKVIVFSKPILPAKFKLFAIVDSSGNQSAVGNLRFRDSIKVEVGNNTKSMIFGIQKTELDFIYTMYLIKKSTGEILYETNNWQYAFFTPRFPYVVIDAKYFNKTGDYEIQVVPKLSSSFKSLFFQKQTLRYNLKVKNVDEKLFSAREIILIIASLIAIFGAILGIVLVYIKRKNQKKLAFVQQQKELSKIQLNSIRSQLNPHFMFNALAGIQNLMNTNKIDEANRYLGKFSRLTRNVLDGKELISLAEEKILLEDYLQMEQFRFGFNYELKIDKNLNQDNIEIPTMLLQPFVENAVKHGISEMGTEGQITISFAKEFQNLVLKVTDNGKGFETAQNYRGLGLQLSKNRITLLNTIYSETPFILAVQSAENGSEITLTLTQWL